MSDNASASSFFGRKREVVLDTETTGLCPKKGHRVVEVGCVELLDLVPSGNTFHAYINPKRDMPQPAFAVHGLSQDFLSNFPPFEDIAQDLRAFLGDAPLVIHNAAFDMKFLHAEFVKAGLAEVQNEVVDTLAIARQKYPGAPASLDMLCRRFNIDNSKRDKHGALLDAELLSGVYLELSGGKQPTLSLVKKSVASKAVKEEVNSHAQAKQSPQRKRTFPVSADEKEAHSALLKKLGAPPWSIS